MGCLFCDISEGKVPVKTVLDEPDLLAFHDINPQAPVHVLIIPKTHIASLAYAGVESAELLGKLMAAARTVANNQGILESGFRVVINSGRSAGQIVDHLHLHVIGGRDMIWPPG